MTAQQSAMDTKQVPASHSDLPGQLSYVPAEVFDRLSGLDVSAEQRAAIFSALCRINVLYMVAKAGSGHLGTCFSSLDIMSWVYLEELRNIEDGDGNCDIFFSSKGHDAPSQYAVLMARGLLDFGLIHQLRRLHGLPGHPHVETPYLHCNTGSLGMGISKAKGMAEANRLNGIDRKVFVMTGDGELQEGQIWESLSSAARRGLSEITAIVDHNKIQSDTWVRDVSPLGDLEAKFAGFGWYVARCDGHDFGALNATLRDLEAVTDKPKVLIADTIKGKGVSFMESTAIGPDGFYHYHSGAPTDDEYDRGLEELLESARGILADAGIDDLPLQRSDRLVRRQHGKQERLVAAYSKALVEQAERDPSIVVLDADLILDCGLIPYQERFPDRYIQCGIAEQDMVSQAGGLALMGMTPIAHSFACFLSTRPNEQIYNNATENKKVIYVGSLAGLLPGGPGHSHQSVRDISTLGAVPKLILIEPCMEIEVTKTLEFCLNGTDQSSYLRLCSMGWQMPFTLPDDYEMIEGRGAVVRDGTDVVAIGYGPWLLSNAWHAAEHLADNSGVSLRVINLPWLNRIDGEWLREAIDGCGWVFALDNHYVHGGQGQMVLSKLAEMNCGGIRAGQIGLTEIPECGGTAEVQKFHRLDSGSLADWIAAAMQEPSS